MVTCYLHKPLSKGGSETAEYSRNCCGHISPPDHPAPFTTMGHDQTVVVVAKGLEPFSEEGWLYMRSLSESPTATRLLSSRRERESGWHQTWHLSLGMGKGRRRCEDESERIRCTSTYRSLLLHQHVIIVTIQPLKPSRWEIGTSVEYGLVECAHSRGSTRRSNSAGDSYPRTQAKPTPYPLIGHLLMLSAIILTYMNSQTTLQSHMQPEGFTWEWRSSILFHLEHVQALSYSLVSYLLYFTP
jgi:hypothetical protein